MSQTKATIRKFGFSPETKENPTHQLYLQNHNGYYLCPKCLTNSMYETENFTVVKCTACGWEAVDRKQVKGKWKL